MENLEHKKNIKCVYCLEEKKSSESDVIPYALIGNKKMLLQDAVCVKCNNDFNSKVENKIIREMAVFRNHLGVKGRESDCAKFKVQYIYESKTSDLKVEFTIAKASSVNDVFNLTLFGRGNDGKVYKFSNVEKFNTNALEEKDKIIYIDIEKEFSNLINIPANLFWSNLIKRFVAKICFEWFILESKSTYIYDAAFDRIRNYIMKDNDENNIVDIITDKEWLQSFYDNENFKVYPGEYVLFFEYKESGEIIAYFCFLGLMFYRVKLTERYNKLHISSISKIKIFNARSGEQRGEYVILNNIKQFSTIKNEINSQIQIKDLLSKRILMFFNIHKLDYIDPI